MANDRDELTMTVSPVCTKDGQKLAYVSFSDNVRSTDTKNTGVRSAGVRSAEGIIPDCKIIKNSGFTEDEVGQLELYMKMKLGELKKRAASVSPVKAMLKEK